jgi:hypothetical protein
LEFSGWISRVLWKPRKASGRFNAHESGVQREEARRKLTIWLAMPSLQFFGKSDFQKTILIFATGEI